MPKKVNVCRYWKKLENKSTPSAVVYKTHASMLAQLVFFVYVEQCNEYSLLFTIAFVQNSAKVNLIIAIII